ncbi:MAG: ABC transporter substrate-binding protein [Chryseolinea sp.]
MKKLTLLILCVVLFACEKKESSVVADKQVQTVTKYASGFNIQYLGNVKLVEVTYPFQGATSGYKYLLVPKGDSIPAHDADVKIIRTPLTSIVCTSTTHIPLLDYLNESDKLVGFPSMDYISSERMRARIDAGEVKELGVDKGLNIEVLAMLKPDMVMGYTMSSDFGQFKKIEELNIPVVINSEYLEKHPLGRAEWIKFMAAFFNKEKEADSIFQVIEKQYNDTKALADKVANKPTVLSGVVYGDAWFLPGGKNYAARLLQDAGCHYLWDDDASNGYLELSFEGVYEKAHDADLWIGVASYASLDEIKKADHRYENFKPLKQKQVYTYDARKGAKGGSEFLELGYLRPDMILQDLVKIAHPELLPDYTLFFHKQLE